MGLFYKITSANGRDSYLFGTMHVNHPDVVALPIEVKEAFDCSDYFLCEANFDRTRSDILSHVMKQWLSTDLNQASCLKESDPTYLADVQAVLQQIAAGRGDWITYGLLKLLELSPDLNLKTVPPCLIYLLQNRPADNPNLRLDKRLYDESIRQQKPFGYLETIQEVAEFACGVGLDYSSQKEIYDYMKAAAGKDITSSYDNLLQKYLHEEIDDLLVQRERDTFAKAPEIVRFYCIEWMLNRRNMNMGSRMLPYLQQGNAFFAVGAAHLIGIVNLLKEQHFSITSIPLSKRCHPISSDTPMYYSQLASAFFPKNPPPMPEAKRLLLEEEQNDGFTMVDWAEKAPISNPDENEDFIFIPQ